MQLLDLIIPGQPYHPRPRQGFGEIIRPTVDTVTLQPESTDTLTSDTLVSDTTNVMQGLVNGTGTGGDESSMMLWAAIVVLCALSLCVYFAYSYRHRLHVTQ